MYNKETFDVQKFGGDAISRVSKVDFLSSGHKSPKQVWYYLQGYNLKEDTSIMQLTDPEEYDFYTLERE